MDNQHFLIRVYEMKLNQKIQKWKGSLRQVSIMKIQPTVGVRIQIVLSPSLQMKIQTIKKLDLKAKTEE